MMASNEDWIVPASHDERRYVLSEVKDIHRQDQTWFGPLHKQMEEGGLSAMLFDLLNFDLGDWHPRHAPTNRGLLGQQARSLPFLDAWWEELLQTGTLAGCDPKHPNCARVGDYDERIKDENSGFDRIVRRPGLYSQARSIVPQLRNHTSNSALANYLKDRGCIVREQVRVLRRSGWQFPPLDDCRRDWERRFPGWPWRDPELNEWGAEEVDDDDDDFNDYAKVKGKSTRF